MSQQPPKGKPRHTAPGDVSVWAVALRSGGSRREPARFSVPKTEETMIRLMLANFLMAFAIGSAAVQAPDTCASKAIGKDGREQQTAAKFVCL